MGELCCVWPMASLFLSVLFFLILFTFGVDYIFQNTPYWFPLPIFNLATWLPSLNLAAKIANLEAKFNLADVMDGTRGKHTEIEKLDSQT